MTPDKKTVCELILSRGDLFLHFDPRFSEVIIPPWLKHQASCVLQYGINMPIPIPDLRITEHGIQATLSFSRTPFKCFVPWTVVYSAIDDAGRGAVWPESMPAEIQAEVDAEQAKLTRKRQQFPAIKLNAVPTRKQSTALARLQARGLRVIKGGNGGGYDDAS